MTQYHNLNAFEIKKCTLKQALQYKENNFGQRRTVRYDFTFYQFFSTLILKYYVSFYLP